MAGNSLPGYRTGISENSPAQLLGSVNGVIRLPGGAIIDATYAYDGKHTDRETHIRQGTPLAKITASNLWVPTKRTTVSAGGSGSGAGTSQEIPVVDSRAFKAGDTISVGGDTGLTVSSVDYDNDIITVSDSAFSYSTGEAVIGSGDLAGSETTRAFLNEYCQLRDDDGIDRDKTVGEVIVAGLLNDDAVLGDLAAIRTSGNSEIGQITWLDTQGS